MLQIFPVHLALISAVAFFASVTDVGSVNFECRYREAISRSSLRHPTIFSTLSLRFLAWYLVRKV